MIVRPSCFLRIFNGIDHRPAPQGLLPKNPATKKSNPATKKFDLPSLTTSEGPVLG